MAGNPKNIALEPAGQEFVDATANPPFLYQLPPAEGRKVVDSVQDSPIFKPEVDEEWLEIAGGPTGTVKIRIVKPAGTTSNLPVILYVHGAGWVFGDAHTHDRLVRDLAIGSNAAVVFPEYDRSPESPYPGPLEQSYAAAKWVVEEGANKGLDVSRFGISGDSVGGNMAIAICLLAAERNDDIVFRKLVAFYPVTNAAFDTGSYEEFAEGYFLSRDGMKWFWDQYTTSEEERALPTVSPLRASLEKLATMPETLIITAEADVLRDEGEAFAARLREAGVKATNARFGGIHHDFVMVNSVHDTEASKHALMLATASFSAALA
ncbi:MULTISPECIES: alpha/beta hydrolase [unclassified Curtobacterium]|uniref:alpha/beta hydrolase n=1 Tax=unclassified Curtobacterium TaxID=257496 RepID=UPI000D8DFF9E|nr:MULTISPECIES: alpha/beta hydrolase [unclassified Curtobacterium]PYY32502.1 esterase [Curtobacterium sp. MCBD17_030]PZE86879.1 esterase [Curtobacterium sp. MCBD17_032]